MDADTNNGVLLWDTLHSSVWLNVIRQLTVKERFAVSLVCRSWRAHALSLVDNDFKIDLVSSRSCRELGVWLRRHGALLSTLNITDNFYNHVTVPGSTRIGLVDRLVMLQGLHGNGRPLQLQSLSLCLNELSAADAAVLGLCNCPGLTCLKLDSNGANIGMTGAQALAPLSQLQHLVVPTQSLGDQGLQIICSSMPSLQHINLHNDGHVTDDGLLALQRLSGLTSLDLQGSISITNRGMAVLAEGVPQLLELNISWCAGVDDWGMGQLCSLTRLTNLNLAATGIHLQAATLLESLSQLQQLAVLRVDRCNFQGPCLQALATSLIHLQDLNLSCNHLASFSELRALSDLAQLTRLDVSHPQALQHPDKHLADVFELTQLHSLSANHLLPRDGKQRAAYSIVHLNAQAQDPGTACKQPLAEAASHGSSTNSSANVDASTTTAAASSSSSKACYPMSDMWQKLCSNLKDMSRLTELNFFGNFSEWWPTSPHAPEHLFSGCTLVQQRMAALECAVVVNTLAAVSPKPVIQSLQISVPTPVQGVRFEMLQAMQQHRLENVAAAADLQQHQLLCSVAALLAQTRWTTQAVCQLPGANPAGHTVPQSHVVHAAGTVSGAQQAAGNCSAHLLSAVAKRCAPHAMYVDSTAETPSGYKDADGQSNIVGSAGLRQQCRQHLLAAILELHTDIERHHALQAADLCNMTAAEAAAVVKQVLPSLRFFKLTLQQREQQDADCVTWTS